MIDFALQHEGPCKQIIQQIVSSVTAQIPTCLPSLDQLVQRSRYDRLSVLAATTIILAHAHFDIPSEQVVIVLSCFRVILCFSWFECSVYNYKYT